MSSFSCRHLLLEFSVAFAGQSQVCSGRFCDCGKTELIPVPEVVVPVDSTAAGDGFNAAYIAARLAGERPTEAAGAAHRLAGQVIRHRGPLMPRTPVAIHCPRG